MPVVGKLTFHLSVTAGFSPNEVASLLNRPVLYPSVEGRTWGLDLLNSGVASQDPTFSSSTCLNNSLSGEVKEFSFVKGSFGLLDKCYHFS